MSGPNSSSTEPTNRFWDVWSWNQHWRQHLEKKATHKALGIPDDDMTITTGMGWRELAIVGALIAGGIWGGTKLAGQDTPQVPAVQQPPPVQPSPTDAAYDVIFFDADGNEIRLDRWPGSVPEN